MYRHVQELSLHNPHVLHTYLHVRRFNSYRRDGGGLKTGGRKNARDRYTRFRVFLFSFVWKDGHMSKEVLHGESAGANCFWLTTRKATQPRIVSSSPSPTQWLQQGLLNQRCLTSKARGRFGGFMLGVDFCVPRQR